MEKRTLIPGRVVNAEGKIYYDKKSWAWSIIRIKSDLIKESL